MQQLERKKLSDIFDISGSMSVLVDFGSIFTTIKTSLDNVRKSGTTDVNGFFKSLLKSKGEFGFNLHANVAFKLSDLTNKFLPDINIGNLDFNLVATLGGGNSKLNAGVYIRLTVTLTFLQDFYNLFKTKLGGVFKFFGINLPDLDLKAQTDLALAITADVVAMTFQMALGDLSGGITCIYRFKDDLLSCAAKGNALFTIIGAIAMTVYKAVKFFEQVGSAIVGAFDAAGNWFGKTFSSDGNLPAFCPNNGVLSVGFCYPPCDSGFYRIMTRCSRYCPAGFRDDGLFCFKPGGYAHFCAFNTCNSGYHDVLCIACSPDCPQYMTDIGISCFKNDKDTGPGSLPTCAPDQEYHFPKCYKKGTYKKYLKMRNALKRKTKKVLMETRAQNKSLTYAPTPSKNCSDLADQTTCTTNNSCFWGIVADIKNKKYAPGCLIALRNNLNKHVYSGSLTGPKVDPNTAKIPPPTIKIAPNAANPNKPKT